MSGKTSYKLVYFDVRARAEPTRLAFKAAGVEFEDMRIKQEDWQKEKPKAPQGRLPYLEISEEKKETVKVSQSAAILRYVGNKYGMYGENDMQKVFIDEIIETCSDLLSALETAFFGGSDEKEKAEKMKKFQEESVPKFYPMLEKCVQSNGNDGYAVGRKLSIADCMLYNIIENSGTECLDKYKCLKSNREKVAKEEKIKKYLEGRPQRPF